MKIKVSRFMAEQYANPSGLFGRLITAGLLNRANQKSNQAVYKALDAKRQHHVLEIGFGGGSLLFQIAKHLGSSEVYGLEKSQSMLQRAQTRIQRDKKLSAIKLGLGGIDALPYEDASFDRICSVNTLYFWPDLKEGCRELARVSANDALVVLGFGSGNKLAANGYSEKGFTFYKPELIHQAMAEAGLSLVNEQRIERKAKDPFFVSTYRKS